MNCSDVSASVMVFHLKHIVWTALLILGVHRTFAQHPDSLFNENDSILILELKDTPLNFPEYKPADHQSIHSVHVYKNPFRLELGNTGSPGYLLCAPLPDATQWPGFKSGFTPALLQHPDLEKLKYYHVNTPFTISRFFLGSKNEQQFAVLHTQNIRPGWNIGLDFERLNNEGFYVRQRAIQNLFRTHSNYRSPDQRYQLYADYLASTHKMEENGGISVDTFFTQNLQTNRQAIPVNLGTAYNRRKTTTLHLKQYFHPGKARILDTDTTDTVAQRYPTLNGWRLKLHHQLENTRYRYEDDLTTTFYDTTFIYDHATDDRSHWLKWTNAFHLEYIGKQNADSVKPLKVSLGVGHQYHAFQQNGHRKVFRHIIIPADLKYPFGTSNAIHFYGRYIVAGDFVSNYTGGATYNFRFRKEKWPDQLTLGTQRTQMQPDWIFTRYYGNHHQWENRWDPVIVTKGFGNLLMADHLNIKVDLARLRNWTYFNALAVPTQAASAITVFQASINKKLQWGKEKAKWNNNLSISYQNIHGADAIRLPAFLVWNRIAAEVPMFKKAMTGRLGLEVRYYTSYKGNAYMPATGVFYQQDSLVTGNYPLVDVFFNGSIKTVRFFVKMTHIQSGLMGFNYWAAPHYALRDRAFRFGLTWKFYD